eukprot:1155803-Pelagomonas_calceolata.AAC.3
MLTLSSTCVPKNHILRQKEQQQAKKQEAQNLNQGFQTSEAWHSELRGLMTGGMLTVRVDLVAWLHLRRHPGCCLVGSLDGGRYQWENLVSDSRSAICLVRRLRLVVRCLVEGSSRLDVRTKTKRRRYPTKTEVRPSPKLSESSWIIAAAVPFQSEAEDNGCTLCTDNVKDLTWGSIGGVKFIKLISEDDFVKCPLLLFCCQIQVQPSQNREVGRQQRQRCSGCLQGG